jgi:hypothetical protein
MAEFTKNEIVGVSLLLVLLIIMGFVTYTYAPVLINDIFAFFEPGLGLKNATIISFFVTTGLFIVFAIFSGDGLIGELQFMIGGFFLFFTIFTFLLAWTF